MEKHWNIDIDVITISITFDEFVDVTLSEYCDINVLSTSINTKITYNHL